MSPVAGVVVVVVVAGHFGRYRQCRSPRREMAHGRPEFRCATAPNSTVTISQRNIVIAFLRLDFTSEVAHRNRR
jgi:hypothetical protein